MSENPSGLRTINTTRYVTPLREGGSMPALVEADDGFLYVLKFRSAGQGTKALIAELIGGEIARVLGFKVPELAFVHLDEGMGRMEGDEEIQDLLKGSVGLNLGLHYLSGSITFDPVATDVDPLLASQIVWLDSFLMNMDRTARNTNLLWWNRELWLIDHGAALYWQHSWNNSKGTQAFPLIKNHVLISKAGMLKEVDAAFSKLITPEAISKIVETIPTDWLDDHAFEDPEDQRKIYQQFLETRVAQSPLFVKEADNARISLI